MANPLFGQFATQNNVSAIIREAQNFKNQFKGNPRDTVQRMLNDGTLSQADFNRLMPIAQQIAAMMPKHS
jgi:hypothetical protein